MGMACLGPWPAQARGLGRLYFLLFLGGALSFPWFGMTLYSCGLRQGIRKKETNLLRILQLTAAKVVAMD